MKDITKSVRAVEYPEPSTSAKDRYDDPVQGTVGKGEKFLVFEDRNDDGKKQTRAFTQKPFNTEREAISAMKAHARAYPSNYTKKDNRDDTMTVTKKDGKSTIKFYVKKSKYYHNTSGVDSSGVNGITGGRRSRSKVSIAELRELLGRDSVKVNADGTMDIVAKGIKISKPKQGNKKDEEVIV